MAEWITIQDLIDTFSAGDANKRELPYLRVESDGTVILNEIKINSAIVSAREEIESYLAAAGVPTNPTPDSVIPKMRECALNITRYYYSNVDGAMFTTIKERYEVCIKRLELIRSGKIKVWEDPDTGTTNGGIQQVPLWRG